MMPIKRRLANKYLAEKYKALKDLENGLSTKILLQNTVSHETLFRKKNKHKLTASLEKRE